MPPMTDFDERVVLGLLHERVEGWPERGPYRAPAPPMQWIEAVHNSADAQESWQFSPRRAIAFA